MSLSLLIPDDLHTQLRACAQLQHASVDAFALALMRDALNNAPQAKNQVLAQRQTAAMRLMGMGKHWSPERDAVAELIAERIADDAH